MSSLRFHGSVQPYGNEHNVTIEIAGFMSEEEAKDVNKELAVIIAAYLQSVRGGRPVDHGTGTPPWKTKQ